MWLFFSYIEARLSLREQLMHASEQLRSLSVSNSRMLARESAYDMSLHV